LETEQAAAAGEWHEDYQGEGEVDAFVRTYGLDMRTQDRLSNWIPPLEAHRIMVNFSRRKKDKDDPKPIRNDSAYLSNAVECRAKELRQGGPHDKTGNKDGREGATAKRNFRGGGRGGLRHGDRGAMDTPDGEAPRAARNEREGNRGHSRSRSRGHEERRKKPKKSKKHGRKSGAGGREEKEENEPGGQPEAQEPPTHDDNR